MVEPPITDTEILANVERRTSRSELVEWLRINYDEMIRISRAGGIDWSGLAADLNKKGVLNQRGKSVSAKTVKVAWFRLKKVREALPPAAARPQADPKPTPPSRLGPGWQPPIAREKPKTEAALGSSVAPTPPTNGEGAPSSPRRTVADMTPQESMERALREMDRRANRRAGLRD